jgi:HSP20 family molecular chaperone IbpA
VGDAITQDDIKAKFEDGVLKISVPKKEAKPQVEEKKFIAIEG